MPLGAPFWSGGGASALWFDMSTFDAGVISVAPDASGMWPCWLGPCKIYQEPMVVGGNQSKTQNNPGYDSGYFYGLKLDAPDIGFVQFCDGVFLAGNPEADGSIFLPVSNQGQWQMLEPWFDSGDLVPLSPNASGAAAGWDKSPVYKVGFMLDGRPTGQLPVVQGGGSIDTALKVYADGSVLGQYRMWHYSPWSWSGTPPEVIAAAAMYAGVSEDDIFQDGFDDAHDAYDLSTGDSPWSDLFAKWTVYARRTVGEGVAGFLLQLAQHSRDFIFVNESGKLALDSFTRPSFTATGVSLEDDGFLKIVSWESGMKHTFNTVSAGWGSAGRQTWEGSGSQPTSQDIGVVYEPNLESKPGDKWVHNDTDTVSVQKYGSRWLPGRETFANFRGHPQKVKSSHYPYLLGPFVSDRTDWEPADGGGMVHVTNWLASDAKPHVGLTVEQGAMGFDLGIGDQITDLEITGDGRTLAECRIIKRDYNFDALTMQSEILEIPPNT